MVRTQDFHSCNRGSIPRSAANGNGMNTKIFFSDIALLISNPLSIVPIQSSKSGKWNYIFVAVLYTLIGGFVASNIAYGMGLLFGYNALIENDHFQNLDTNLINLVLYGVIIAPIIEEVAFRLQNTTHKRTNIIGVVCFLIYSLLINNPILYIIAILYGVWMLSCFIVLSPKKTEQFIAKNLKYSIWFLILYFAFLHLMNFDTIEKIWFISFLFIIPQIISGIAFTLVRMKYGILYSTLAHSISNGVVVLVMIIYKQFFG